MVLREIQLELKRQLLDDEAECNGVQAELNDQLKLLENEKQQIDEELEQLQPDSVDNMTP